MNAVDPIFARVTGAGSPFEIGERGGLRQFVNAPADLATLIDSARRFGERTFIVEQRDGGEARRLSYEAVFAWRDRLAARLGISRGERVAICMRNRAEWIVAFLAVMRAGGVAALLNSRGSPAELVAMIDDVSPALVIADSERAALIREGGHAGRLIDLADEAETGVPVAMAADPPAPARADDPCAILFTSGTTGRVKGAVLSHRNLITGLMSVQLSGVMVLENIAERTGASVADIAAAMPQPATILVNPLFHISGLGAGCLSPMLAGGKVVIMRRWDADEALRLVAAERITQFSAVPTMLWDLLNRAAIGSADLSSLTSVATGGQALPVNLLDAMRAACPNAFMGTGYGMTEASGAIAQAVGEDFLRNRASAGRVLPLGEARIVSPDGRIMPTGESGEIQVRGAMVFGGYWNRPEESAAAFTADGWFRTGDVGHIDPDGYIFIVDRLKDMVISGGENIYCAEVERVLGELPGVHECAAFGIPDDRLGELLVAVIRSDGIEPARAIDWVGERLARYKAPARVAMVEAPLPRNHVGKVDKVRLRAEHERYFGAQ